MSLSKALRWEALARDNFTCQYCGRSPRVYKGLVLEVDHRYPRAWGGTDDMDNFGNRLPRLQQRQT